MMAVGLPCADRASVWRVLGDREAFLAVLDFDTLITVSSGIIVIVLSRNVRNGNALIKTPASILVMRTGSMDGSCDWHR